MLAAMRTALLSGPFKGLNKRDPLLNMEEEYATTLVNMIPEPGEVKLRGGTEVYWNPGSTISGLFAVTDTTGADYMVAVSTGDVWNVSSASPSSIKGSVTLNGDFTREACVYRNTLVVGGAGTSGAQNLPFHWAGSGNALATTWTGTTLYELAAPFAYKSRIYYCRLASVWYGPVDTIAVGTPTTTIYQFDFASLLHRGGYIMFGGSVSRATGYLAEELFFVCSSQGEILVYSGSYPGDSSWTIAGRFFIPKPLSRRARISVEGDVYVITDLGLYSILDVMEGKQETAKALTDVIQTEWKDTNQTSNKSCGGGYFPTLNLIWASKGSSGTTGGPVYLQNCLTKGWCSTSLYSAYTPVWFSGSLYFLYNNAIYKYLPTTQTDSGTVISWKVKHASTSLGQPVIKKALRQVMPVIAPSSDAMLLSVVAHMDFNIQAQSAVHTLALSGNYNTNWMGATGLGRTLQLELSGQTHSSLSYLASYLAFHDADLF